MHPLSLKEIIILNCKFLCETLMDITKHPSSLVGLQCFFHYYRAFVLFTAVHTVYNLKNVVLECERSYHEKYTLFEFQLAKVIICLLVDTTSPFKVTVDILNVSHET